MTTTKNHPHHDAFDLGFLRVLKELQKIGWAKNISAIENHLGIPKRTIYQVRLGSRSIPLIHRSRILKFFVSNYDVNADIFKMPTVAVFRHTPPDIDITAENYVTASAVHHSTSGDRVELEKLRLENAAMKNELARINSLLTLENRIENLEKELKKKATKKATKPKSKN